MDGITEGRIVHFVMPDGNSAGQHRPAMVVNAWHNHNEYQQEGRVNLQVFTDFGNDGKDYESGRYWATSVPFSGEPKPGTWHWIEKVTPEATKNADLAVTAAPPVKIEQVVANPTKIDWYDFGKSAYHAYGAVTDHKNYQGLPMPEWEALTDKIREAWIGAVRDVFRKLNVTDDATGKLYVE